MAFLGDAVYELYIREYLIDNNICNVNDLQKECTCYVSAERQAYFVQLMLNDNFLNEEEIDIYKRGRNASSHKSKSTDIVTYKKSTGLEALIGYLYKIKNYERIKEIMKFIVGVK